MPRSFPFLPTRAPELGVPLEDAPFAPGPVEAPPEASLRVNFYWTLAGHVVAAGCKWLELTLLAKAGTRDMVGQFAYALALTAPVSLEASWRGIARPRAARPPNIGAPRPGA